MSNILSFAGLGTRLERGMPERVITGRALTSKPSLRLNLPYIKNQVVDGDDMQCCVSAAMTICMEYLEVNTTGKELSMLFHYHYASYRSAYQTITFDEGIIAGEDYGICENTLHDLPLSAEAVAVMPTTDAQIDGEDRLIESSMKLSQPNDTQAWLQWLDVGYPLILLFRIDRESYLKIPDNKNVYSVPRQTLPNTGHAVVVIGYDTSRRIFIIQDSRGEDWCDKGKWYLPFDVAASHNFTHTVGIIKNTSKGALI